MKKEYKVVEFQKKRIGMQLGEEFENLLNEMGNKGWILKTILFYDFFSYVSVGVGFVSIIEAVSDKV